MRLQLLRNNCSVYDIGLTDHYPEGASQRTLLRDAGYSQSNKIRRWLQEKISILWDMTIIPGKCYKYVLISRD